MVIFCLLYYTSTWIDWPFLTIYYLLFVKSVVVFSHSIVWCGKSSHLPSFLCYIIAPQSWLVPQCQLYGMKLPTRFQLIGQVSLAEYTKWTRWFQESHSLQPAEQREPISFRTYARYMKHVIECIEHRFIKRPVWQICTILSHIMSLCSTYQQLESSFALAGWISIHRY